MPERDRSLIDSGRTVRAARRQGRHTATVVRLALTRFDAASVVLVTGFVYLVAFLRATRNLAFEPGAGVSWIVVDRPLERLFERTGPVSFEPIAQFDLGVVSVLFSPIEFGLALVLAALVGINLALAYLAIVQPESCGIGAGAGLTASLPALVSGSVCCAPVILVLLGIQAGGALLAVLSLLLPLASRCWSRVSSPSLDSSHRRGEYVGSNHWRDPPQSRVGRERLDVVDHNMDTGTNAKTRP